jgi:hypothetical protein
VSGTVFGQFLGKFLNSGSFVGKSWEFHPPTHGSFALPLLGNRIYHAIEFCSFSGKYGLDEPCVVDCQNGFRCASEIHHSHQLGGNVGRAITMRLLTKMGILERTVNEEGVEVIRNARQEWFTVGMDRKFTSVRHALDLYRLGVEVIGTCR